jgi:flagellar biosynthesis protein FlhF
MLNRVKVFADDSVEAMAKITRELGGDARIYSTRQVNGGIEIIAGPPDDEEEAEMERPERFNRTAKKEEINFADLLATARAASSRDERPARPVKPTPVKPAARAAQHAAGLAGHTHARIEPAPASAPVEDNRLVALEKSVAEIKSMLGSDLMANGLRAAGATPELIAVFLAQSGAYDHDNADRKFGTFLAKRLLHPNPKNLIAPPRVIVTLGPSGSGKTTLLAHMAARLRMADPDARVTFVNADSSRLGAAEQLRAYGRILDIPVVDIEHVNELSEFSQSVDPDLTMLVDMPSNTDECAKLLETIEENRYNMAPITRIGVIAANLASDPVGAMLDRYTNLDALALTKLGEAQPTLATLGSLALRRAPVAYLSANPHLTRGMVEPTIEDLEQLIRGAIPGHQVLQ